VQDQVQLEVSVRNDPTSTLQNSPAIDLVKWSGPRKCDRRGCTSKAVFPSRSSFKAHLKNIHVSPLVCIYAGCSNKKPFGKPCDLKRHLTTVHSTKDEYQCLEDECQEMFSRKDNMLKHARENHQLFQCCWNHCKKTVFAVEQESHAQESHGQYECAIGSCQSGGKSCFNVVGL
jgi:hypothetical protein